MTPRGFVLNSDCLIRSLCTRCPLLRRKPVNILMPIFGWECCADLTKSSSSSSDKWLKVPTNNIHVIVRFAMLYTKGAFFWDYSGMSLHGIDGRCVLLGGIPIPEWTEYYSVHSAPEGGMSRIILKPVYSVERNRPKPCSFGRIHEPATRFLLAVVSSQANSSTN